jgi:hypothetical protein
MEHTRETPYSRAILNGADGLPSTCFTLQFRARVDCQDAPRRHARPLTANGPPTLSLMACGGVCL